MAGRRLSDRCCPRVWWVCLVLAAALWPAALPAAPEVFTLIVPDCAPTRGNSVISLSTTPETGWSSVRTYFRKTGSPDYYFVEMRSAGRGKYWAALPRPEESTATLDVQMAVRDVEGKESRSPVQKLPVTTSCSLSLSPEQVGFAQNLVVGETSPSQTGQVVVGFLCDGVISRIDASGNLKPDESCRRMEMLAAAAAADEESRRRLIPLIILGGGGVALISHKDPPEASQPRP